MEQSKVAQYLSEINALLDQINKDTGATSQFPADSYERNIVLTDAGLDSLGIYELYLFFEDAYGIPSKTVRIWLEDPNLTFAYTQGMLKFIEENRTK